uniref:Uncharacterized shell protein 1 n=1 Tax=Margaritifera margaritifera TaxID=102329 RepID=USP1_PINMG|nr:RecName: Full=Uncharacterized shell protein 1; AltName: Full=Prism tissue inhibitor metalloproteinase protein 1; Flags: Precursor [Pinctada margaritifera]CCE46165.1 prism tissue inhibitor metalloproteinase protein 1 [Pinctada margaritifera]
MQFRPSIALVLSIVGILSLEISWTDGCTCFMETRREKCQRSTFGFIGYPYFAGRTNIGGMEYNRFCFFIVRIHKGLSVVFGEPCVYSSVSSAACGTGFYSGSLSIVNGYIESGVKQVNLCGWNERWRSVPSFVKFMFLTQPNWCYA